MKNVFKKVAIASALVAASSASFADEIGNVQVDVNYVSTCTVTNAPVATFTDIVPGTLPTTEVTIDIECSSSSDDASVTLWLQNTQLYAEDAEHFVLFLPSDFVLSGDSFNREETITFFDGNPNANAPVTTLTPGTNSYTVSLTAALGSVDGLSVSTPTVYDTVSLQVPVNVEF